MNATDLGYGASSFGIPVLCVFVFLSLSNIFADWSALDWVKMFSFRFSVFVLPSPILFHLAKYQNFFQNLWFVNVIIIGPESDHWQFLSLTHWLTHWLTKCRLVNLIDMTLACEVNYSKLVEVVTVADNDNEDRVGNSLLQIWKLRFGQKAKLLFRFWAQGLARILKLSSGKIWGWPVFILLIFCRGYEVESWSGFWS